MKKLCFLMILLLVFSESKAQQYLGPLTVFKATIKLKNGDIVYKILYDIKADEIILVDDNLLIINQLRSRTDLKFSSILIENEITSLKIRRRKYFLNYLGKSIIAGAVLGTGIAFIEDSNNQNNDYLSLNILAGTLAGAYIGLITSPILGIIPRKSYSKSELKNSFPVEELKIFTAKWQIENRLINE